MQTKKTTPKAKNTPKVVKHNKAPIIKHAGISYLNIVALGPSNINLAYLLTSTIIDNNCHIISNHTNELNQDTTFNACINGKWNNIVKLEKSIALLSKKYPVHIYTKRSYDNLNNIDSFLYYAIQTTTIDKPGLMYKLLQFFNTEQISLKYTKIAPKAYNGNMVDIEIHIKLPTDVHILSFRERFLTYCDQLNLDASLEPIT